MKAIFGSKQRRLILSNGVSHIYLIPMDLYIFYYLKLEVETFQNERRFGMAVAETKNKESVFIKSTKKIILNVELIIKHGKSLMIL